MKLTSWNVNGLRAIQKKGFESYLHASDADIFCLQETKLQADQLDLDLGPYRYSHFNYAERKGYSGVGVLSKIEPLSVELGIGHALDNEGRVVTAEFDSFYLVCCYTPNSQDQLARLDTRLQWDEAFRNYVTALKEHKSVIICGDLNVAHQPIDLKNPKNNERNAGYSIEERTSFTSLLDAGFIDTFRLLYPSREEAYSWWSYRFKARQRNIGWRIDYWLVSEDLKHSIADSTIEEDVMGSDHAPVTLYLSK
jgi:exodeoxyribonuclease-3